MGDSHTHSYRACFGDTDAGGIVYHARYFEMAERDRNEALRAVGVSIGELFRGGVRDVGDGDGEGLARILHRGLAKFETPAFVDDLLTMRTGTLKVGAARSWWRTVIRRDRDTICTVDVELVCIRRANKTPVLMPSFMAEAVKRIAAAGNGGPTTSNLAKIR